ncbi:unnamed protein product, partial [Staurois parvus]
VISRLWPFDCHCPALETLFLPLTPTIGQIPSTDTNDGALFLPLIAKMGQYSSH